MAMLLAFAAETKRPSARVSAALFLPMVPAFAGILGAVTLGEWPTQRELLGTACVIAGMALALHRQANGDLRHSSRIVPEANRPVA
jgi:drug/metabolite transporter (DMT)-like permease